MERDEQVLTTVFVVVTIAVIGTADADAGPIRISGVSCRGEWVDVQNTSNQPRNLRGFRLFDHNKVHRYDFEAVNVPAGAKVRVWSAGKSGGPVRRWYTGWDQAIWNDSGESATLVNPNRDVVSTKACDDAAPPARDCQGYNPCLTPGLDVDCLGGGGNGPRYVQGPVRVTGSDPYRLDGDGDGWGCED